VSRSLSRFQAVILGAVVLTGLALAAGGLFAVGSRHWLGSDSFQVAVAFQDIGGVEPGTRVRIQGIDAGEVEAIDLPAKAGEPIHLRLRLGGRFRHLIGDPATARVQITSEGLFAGKFVKILPGNPSRQPLPDQVVLRSQPPTELTEELSQTAKKLKHALGEVDSTLQAVRKGEGTLGQLVKNDKLYNDLTRAADQAHKTLAEIEETFGQVKGALKEIRSGEGTLGQLVKSKDAYRESLQTIEQVREMVNSVKQNADALKSMPIVRSYVTDPHKELHRPDCTMHRKWVAEARLFEPGRAVLTAQGRKELAHWAEWLNGHKEKGSEVVVASYAAPGQKFEAAQTLTQKQAEVVRDYLTGQFKVHKTGWWFWSKRKVKAVGCGSLASPIPGDAGKKYPAPRVEVLVFVPQA
jgi:phospholipid/cholesterol/gamma-HCH transport system substrate-binding protein